MILNLYPNMECFPARIEKQGDLEVFSSENYLLKGIAEHNASSAVCKYGEIFSWYAHMKEYLCKYRMIFSRYANTEGYSKDK